MIISSHRVAGLTLELHEEHPTEGPVETLPAAYDGFSGGPAERAEITVRSEVAPIDAPTADAGTPRCETTQWIAYRSQGAQVFLLKSIDPDLPIWRSAVRNTDGRTWRIKTAPEVKPLLGLDRYPHALSFPLAEMIFLDALTAHGRLIFHACGVRDNGYGMLFTGRSGRGKSTIGRLWGDVGATILSDDRVAVREERDVPIICGTPWHGDLRRVTADEGPLHALFFLEHAQRTHIERISPLEAQRRMLMTVWHPVWTGQQGLSKLWEQCSRLTRAVPVYRLEFRPEAATIELLRQTVAGPRSDAVERASIAADAR